MAAMPASPPARSARSSLYLPFVLLALVAAGWSAFWWVGAARAGREADAWIAREAGLGRAWACADRAIGGYPFRFELRCAATSLDVEGAGGGPARLRAGPLRAVALAYKPGHVIVELDGPLAVEPAEGGPFTVDWRRLSVSGQGVPGPEPRFDQAELMVEAPTLRLGQAAAAGAGAQPLAGAERLEAYLRRRPDAPPGGAFDLAVRAARAAVPALDALSGNQEPGEIDARAVLAPADTFGGRPADLDRWRAAGGTLTLESLRVDKGPAALAASGTLTLDEARRPAGRLEATLIGLDRLLGPLASPLAGLFGAPKAKGGRGVPVSLTIREGRIMLGPLRLGTVPPLY